ncbi:MAG: XTP/dITP diphosphohydrolase [Verrucomicrobiota bacterium]|jgi:XTP/dITP diphosphohydrolase
MDLLLATRNVHKTGEFAQLLGDHFKIVDLNSFPQIAAVEETGSTFAENAILKAIGASKQYVDLVVADDSGLEVEALDGAPGIFSARYAGENASDEQNIEKLLRELRETEKRNARFCCVIALARAGRSLGTFEGVVEGEIVDLARGANGFGYDPIFMPDGFDKTFAELGAEVKNQISHRAKAISALRDGVSI